MSWRRVLPTMLLVLVVAGGTWLKFSGRPDSPAPTARLEWEDCWFKVSWWRPVYCARFTTDAGADHAQVHVLPVVYVPAAPWLGSRPPLLYIAGGPGGATRLEVGAIDYWLDWLKQVDWDRDTVFYDQRGVGMATPRVDCPELLTVRRELLPLDLDPEAVGAQLRAAGEGCKRRLERAGVDFTQFTTRHNARDALGIMNAIAPDQEWSVYGVSYGTRVALDLLRLEPGRFDAVVLDSVYPPDVHAERNDPWLLERALRMVSRVCELLDVCQATPQGIITSLKAALTSLDKRPLTAQVRDPNGKGDLTVVYRDKDFAWLLFETLYRWDRLAALPDMLDEFAAGQAATRWQRVIQDAVDTYLDPSFSDAVASAVDCNDAPALSAGTAASMRNLFPLSGPLLASDWEYHYCRFWKVADAGGSFRKPVDASVPTLILAGEFDPVTPPEWAAMTAKHLVNSYVFQFPGVGHGVFDSHVCAVELVNAFLEAPKTASSPACLDAL